MVATMAKAKGDQDDPNKAEDAKEKESSLKVTWDDAALVGKVATMRSVSVKKLFRMKDVQDFFTHLLLEEMRQEAERLKKRKP